MRDLNSILSPQHSAHIQVNMGVFTPIVTATVSLTTTPSSIDLTDFEDNDLFMFAFHGDHTQDVVLSNAAETIYDVFPLGERCAPGFFQKRHNVFTHISCATGTTNATYTIYKAGV